MSVLSRASCIQSAFLRSSRCSTVIPIFVTFGARKNRLWGKNSVNSPVQKCNTGFPNFPNFGGKSRGKSHSDGKSEEQRASNWKTIVPLAVTLLIATIDWSSVSNFFSNWCSQFSVYRPGVPKAETSGDSEFLQFGNFGCPLANLDGDEAGVPFYGRMGLTLINLTGDIVADLEQHGAKVSCSQGVLVVQVVDGSPTFLAGIRPGNIIVKINDTNISSVNHFYGLLDVLKLEAAPSVQFSVAGRRNKEIARRGSVKYS